MLPDGNGGGNELWAPGIACPRCGRRHQTWHRVAECRWHPTCWVAGDAPPSSACWATVSWCARPFDPGPQTTVMIHRDRRQAEDAMRMIDRLACGGACTGRHGLFRLRPDGLVLRFLYDPNPPAGVTT